MDHEELVEKAAAEVRDLSHCGLTVDGSRRFCDENETGPCDCRNIARAVLAIVAEAMRAPSEAMMNAGFAIDPSWLTEELALARWSAMLAASPLLPAKTDGTGG